MHLCIYVCVYKYVHIHIQIDIHNLLCLWISKTFGRQKSMNTKEKMEITVQNTFRGNPARKVRRGSKRYLPLGLVIWKEQDGARSK